ncbi:carbon starvation protein CstA [Salinicoccus sediminis]|uniref:Carbon starvation protein CstA n=1 Tax=Salinicoccus sediminis TaxID=1432562 RepID=A0A0M2SLF0_9STAP|nr:carbon starvation CstA family protein [Salinicoccus sediminis]KKK35063.1 carbon starvation protein CstA [Salinicoccus sediminis]
MLTLIFAIILLIAGYMVYGKIIEKIFVIDDNNETPAYKSGDGVDYIPMHPVKGWLIQLLNIAGLGPVFGAVAGALYGPVALIWIVFGCIFAGAVHDYFSGMLSIRNNGAQFPALVEKYLGKSVKVFVYVVSLVLMILVAAAFTAGPAELIALKTGGAIPFAAALVIIFSYFVIAAILPINKIIGRIYPVFGAILIIMAAAVLAGLMFSGTKIPNLTLTSAHPEELPVWPLLMITISCGAISGFHSTQSPIIARTVRKESEGRKVFFGAMIAEGVLALIWATAGMTFFGGTGGLATALANGGPAGVVDSISIGYLGSVGALLAFLGAVILPITTGDTALRSSRMILTEAVGDYVKVGARPKLFIMTICVGVPAFLLATIDYMFLWRYLGFSNQMVAATMLWVATAYLIKEGKFHFISGLPAIFMTGAVGAYFFYAPETLNMNYEISLALGMIPVAVTTVLYIRAVLRQKSRSLKENTQLG